MDDQQPRELNAKHLKAALLLAEDTLPDKRIAEECGISQRTLDSWKKWPEFQAAIRAKVQELDDAVTKLRFVKRRGRLEMLNRLVEDYAIIAEERAEWFIDNAPHVPGGKTGRIVKQDKIIGTGKNQTRTTEYVLDKALDDGIRSTLTQIAKERGEYSEKREISGPNGTPLLAIVEIEIRKAVEPPTDADDE